MDIFFADDSVQGDPTRRGMGRLVAVGGVIVPSESVNGLERALNQLCMDTGFPPGEEFKWSPGRNGWMRQNLIGDARTGFFLEVVRRCTEHRVRATVIVVDKASRHPLRCDTHEDFATQMLIERIEWLAVRAGRDVIVVFDRPGGGHAEEEDFLARCLETIQNGTRYVRPARIALNALSTSSHFVRLLQTADLFTGCVTAYVAGEPRFAPQIIPALRPLLASEVGRGVGGIGIKIHPDLWYVNLYHWLFGDGEFWRGNTGFGYPILGRPYARSADER